MAASRARRVAKYKPSGVLEELLIGFGKGWGIPWPNNSLAAGQVRLNGNRERDI
jgi:hypothetical protein